MMGRAVLIEGRRPIARSSWLAMYFNVFQASNPRWRNSQSADRTAELLQRQRGARGGGRFFDLSGLLTATFSIVSPSLSERVPAASSAVARLWYACRCPFPGKA